MASKHPRGFGAKVDPTNSNERNLFRAHEAVPFIQVKYSDSHWLLDHDVNTLVGPDQQLILVDWEDEQKFIGRHPDAVVERCIRLEEHINYVFLGDRWTYETLSPRENRTQINRSVALQQYLGRRFEEFGAHFEFNPMLQGWKGWHLERCRPLVDEFGGGFVGWDATGYRSKYELAGDVNHAIEQLRLEGVYVSGRIGRTHLPLLPDEVVAFSGKRGILDEVQLANGEFSRELLHRSVAERVRKFEHPQTELRQFLTATP